MRTNRAKDFVSPEQPHLITADTELRDVVHGLIKDLKTREVYVVDADNRFVGVVPVCRLARTVFAHDVSDTSSATEMLDRVSRETAGDLALRKAVCVQADATLSDALELMFRADLTEVPVIDEERLIVGSLNLLYVLSAWHEGRIDGRAGG